MNLAVLLGGALVWALSIGGAFLYGTNVGSDREVAGQARITQAIERTREAAQLGAADAISKIEVKNVTINRKLETLVRENRVFTDCRSGPDSVRAYNSAINDGAEPAGSGAMPAKDAAGR